MSRDNVQGQVLRLCTLVQENQLNEAAKVLSSVNVEEIVCSSDLTFSVISIEQNASRLLKDCLETLENEGNSGEFIKQIGLFNHRMAILDTEDAQLIRHQSELLLDKDVLSTLTAIINLLLVNDTVHHHPFIRFFSTWLESIAHFVHRHDSLFTDIIEPLRRSILSCVLSDWYSQYINPSSETDISARIFFIRTCSFLTGIFQCNQLSFKNALKTIQSYQIVTDIGRQIFDRHLNHFRKYLQQIQMIEDDTICLTGICLLITNCYKYEVFRDDNAYFTLLLRLLQSDFIRNNLHSTWTNDSTILADTLMVQLKNSTNDSTIRLYLRQNHAADAVYPYMYVEYDRLRLQACMLLGELLDDQIIKQLEIPSEKLVGLYFQSIEYAQKSANKSYKRVPIHMLLKALSALVHNDAIQMVIGKSANYFEYLVAISDDYNIIYDILWTLSFNKDLHGKFHSQEDLLNRLRSFVNEPEKAPEKDAVRAAEGILWNIFNRDQVIALPGPSSNPTEQTPNNPDK